MTGERVVRRLAAILAADVVGYSRLMGRDENGTLARLKAHRTERLEPLLARHGGRLVKLTGDGALVEFPSAVDALSAAIEFQQAMAEANQDQPAETAIIFRIGLHLGDLIVDGDDLYGDGVNVAARLEAEAPPGGILVSRAVREAVDGRLKAKLHALGELSLKNIERPIRAFRVEWDAADWNATAAPAPKGELTALVPATPALALPDKPSIAVLPFQNMSGDPEQEYFADGIVEDIITALSRFKSLFVIARNSTFTYKGKAVDVRQVGRELGVRYVLEGSVRKAGDRVRITGQLIEAATGEHLWAERYDRDLNDVFTLQDEITVRIATAVDPAIRDAQTKAALRKHPVDLGAWDHVLRGLWHLNQFKQAANEAGRRELLAAIERDPGSASAHAWLAMSHVFDAWFNWTQAHAASLERAHQAAALAVKLDPQEPLAHVATTLASFWSGRMDQAKNAAELAISLNPNSFLANFTCGGARNYLGECEAALPYHMKALDLSPNDPLAWNCLGSLAHTYFNLGRFNDAVNCANRAIVLRHGYLFGRIVKAAALGHEGRSDEAAASLRAIFDISPDFSLAKLDHYPFIFDSQRKHLFAGLERAGLSITPTMVSLPAVELALPDKPSIAVLPFQNMSADPEQEYFVDGLVEDIITALSRFKSLFVIARNSSFTYKGSAVHVKQVGRELGVQYVLEGSVRKVGTRVRITGQLADAANGVHLWADRFDGEFADVFELQDRVTSNVVGIIAPMVERAELERSRSKPAGSLLAYDKVLRAGALERSRTRSDVEEAIRILREVIRSDPEYTHAYARLSRTCWTYIAQGYGHRDHPLVSDFAPLAQRGLKLDPTDAYVMECAAVAIAYGGGDIQAGRDLVEKAIGLNPNMAGAYRIAGIFNGYLGEVDRAVEYLQRAERLNPLADSISPNDGRVIAPFGAGDHEAVVTATARVLREHPNSGPSLRYRAASLALLGRIEEARKVVSRLLEARPDYSIAEVRRHHEFDLNSPFKKPGVTESLYRGLRLAGLPE